MEIFRWQPLRRSDDERPKFNPEYTLKQPYDRLNVFVDEFLESKPPNAYPNTNDTLMAV